MICTLFQQIKISIQLTYWLFISSMSIISLSETFKNKFKLVNMTAVRQNNEDNLKKKET